MRKTMFASAMFASAVFAIPAYCAELNLPAFFSNNMVLQREMKIPIWGTAEPDTVIEIKFNEKLYQGKADLSGDWKVFIGPLKVNNKPNELKINEKILKNILVGDVWFCGGQSNMEWTLNRWDETKKTIDEAGNYPNIRMINTKGHISTTPQKDIKTDGWFVNSSEKTKEFSGTGYYFGLNLHKKLDVPIGLISCNMGGSVAESWVSEEALAKNEVAKKVTVDKWNALINDPDLDKKIKESKVAFAKWKKLKKAEKSTGINPGKKPKTIGNPIKKRDRPGNLFRGMLNPYIGFGIKGVIWYQGEGNAMKNQSSCNEYHNILKTLITDWRNRWEQGDFPFLIVQLPSSGRNKESIKDGYSWASIREGQRLTLSLKNTGLAVVVDNKDTSLHPKGKAIVGERLSLLARGIAYNEDIVYTGPLYIDKSLQINENCAIIEFTNIGTGLILKENSVSNFVIKEKEGEWLPAKAKIKENKIIIWNDDIKNPSAVRYGWNSGITPTLYNAEGLLASPFKTDEIAE